MTFFLSSELDKHQVCDKAQNHIFQKSNFGLVVYLCLIIHATIEAKHFPTENARAEISRNIPFLLFFPVLKNTVMKPW